MNDLQKIQLLGVNLTNTSLEDILKYVVDSLEQRTDKYYLVTPNPEMIVLSQKDTSFKDILNHAKLSLVDGVGLVFAAQVLGKGRLERFTGVDFIQELCRQSVKKPIKLGFLGGRKVVAERAVKCLLQKYPSMQVSFINEEWEQQGFENAQKVMKKYREEKDAPDSASQRLDKPSGFNTEPKVRREAGFGEKIDVLFVAFGFPKQEQWIAEHLPNIPVKIAIGVGGAFDYLSGEVKRAPHWAQVWGLEWLFRLVYQPWRVKRQLALLKFVDLVIREKLRKKEA